MVSAYDGGGSGDQILVHADSPITSIADLRGKRIAVGKGSSAHGNILAPARKAPGSRRPMCSWSSCNPPTRCRRSPQHQADAWAIWDPYTAQAEAQTAGSQYRPGARASPTATGSASHPIRRWPIPNATLRWQRSAGPFRQGGAWAKDHPDQWAQSYAAAVGLDPKVAAVTQARSLQAADRAGRRVGGIRTEARRPVRRVQADRRRRTEVRQLGRSPL